MEGKYKKEKAEKIRDLTEGIDYTVYRKQTNYRYHVSYQISPSFKLKSRVELINSHLEETPVEAGYLIYQDIVYKSLKSPFSFAFSVIKLTILSINEARLNCFGVGSSLRASIVDKSRISLMRDNKWVPLW